MMLQSGPVVAAFSGARRGVERLRDEVAVWVEVDGEGDPAGALLAARRLPRRCEYGRPLMGTRSIRRGWSAQRVVGRPTSGCGRIRGA
jgi:hypothetical protein